MKSQENLKMEKSMNKRKFGLKCNVFLLCLVIFMLSGCAKQKIWYKAGNNQADFDLDNRECVRIAKEIGRQATITGKRINFDVYNTSYNNCIFSSGWTHNPPGTQHKQLQPVAMAKVKDNEIHVFDRLVTLPIDFQLINNQIGRVADIKVQTLFFKGKGPVYLNMTMQEASSRQFDLGDYPVMDPFFIFEKGTADETKKPVYWTVFSGDFKGIWVAGIGAHYLVDKNKRINFVLTKDIPSQNESPPEGLRLSKIQKEAVESFSDQWLEKIEKAFGANEKVENENNIMGTGKSFIKKIYPYF